MFAELSVDSIRMIVKPTTKLRKYIANAQRKRRAEKSVMA